MIKALENLSDRITVNYEGEPCYDIVFSKDFSEIGNELKKFNIENKKLSLSIRDAVEKSQEYLAYNDSDEGETLGDLFKGLFDN